MLAVCAVQYWQPAVRLAISATSVRNSMDTLASAPMMTLTSSVIFSTSSGFRAIVNLLFDTYPKRSS